MNDETCGLIQWLNSPDSDEWRHSNCHQVEYSVSARDGLAHYGGHVAFASLKLDYLREEGFSSGFYADSFTPHEAAEALQNMRADPEADPGLLRCHEILWEGFRWTPDQDPTRV